MKTIREKLAGYATLARILMFGGILALVPVELAMVRMGVPRPMRRTIFMGLVALTIGLGILVSYRVRCPRCGTRIFSLTPTAKYCPQCGADFNQPA